MRQKGSDEQSFFAVAGLYPLLFNAMTNPEIGAFRDWDVLAFPALPLSLWAACALLRLEIARYEAVLAEGVLSKHGLAYGWETLAAYCRGNDRHEEALRAFAERLKQIHGICAFERG